MDVKCTFCGGKQKITHVTKCCFCKNLIDPETAGLFYRSSLSGEFGNLMYLAQTAIDVENWDEAILFFNRILEKDIKNSDAWFGKAICTANTSTLADLKFNEAVVFWDLAIDYASNPMAMRKRIAKELSGLVVRFYLSIESHFIRFKSLDNSYPDFLNRFFILESALNYASELNPKNLKILEHGVSLCTRVSPVYLLQNKFINSSKLGKDKLSEWSSLPEVEKLAGLEQKYVEKITKINPGKIQKFKKKEEKLKVETNVLTTHLFGKNSRFGFIRRLFS